MLWLYFALASYVLAFNALLPPKGKVCFHEDLKYGDTLSITFQVGTRDPSSSEQLDVNFWLTSPGGSRVVNLDRVTDGKPSFKVTENGRYEYCFSNEYSNIKSKDVTFHLTGINNEAMRDINTDNLQGQIRLMNRLIQDIQHEQSYIVIRERVHRNTAESTNARVKWWSLFQILVVVGNTIFQIVYLKRFFEVKTNV